MRPANTIYQTPSLKALARQARLTVLLKGLNAPGKAVNKRPNKIGTYLFSFLSSYLGISTIADHPPFSGKVVSTAC